MGLKMADEADDVLELDEADIIEGEELEEVEDQTDGELEEAGDEVVIGFEGEEAAPASEGESSVIRDLRRANREQARRLAELERGQAPKKIEVGEEPSLAGCDYDEDRFKAEWQAYQGRKSQADQQEREAQDAAERQQTEWQERAQAYEADKGKLAVPDYADAEGEVFSTLSVETQALVMLSEKPAALIYALSKSPTKLEQLSKLDLARAAMMIGKLEDKLTMGTRKPPAPDTPVRGNATPGSSDKHLAKLERDADRTGDRSELIAYRRKLRDRA